MRVQLIAKPLSEIKSDALVHFVFEGEKNSLNLELVNSFLKENPKFGKLYETELIYSKEIRILLIGMGKKDEINIEKVQNCFGQAAKSLLQKVSEMTIILPQISGIEADRLVEAAVIGIELAAHDPSKDYKSEKEPVKLKEAYFLVEKNQAGYSGGAKKGAILAEAINFLRKLGDMPANDMTPAYFIKTAKKAAGGGRLKIKILDEKKAARLKMGAFTAVAKGSDEPSYMAALEYQGDLKSKDKWGLVGKGVTFDSGGISIKPSQNLHEMKYDMLGAATVLAVMLTVAKLKLKVNVVGVMAVTENLPNGKAFKPGDIIRTYGGKTAEVLNTDAEGRLILADALSWAQKDFKATKLVDLATLTGAMIIALGDYISGVFSNNDLFAQQLITAGSKVGEKFWQMPMTEEYNEMVKSELADIANIGHGGSHPSAAGSITGAKFIEYFVDKGKPWIHIDIAGTAWDNKPKPYRGAGATGVGVKTLVELLT